MKNKLYESKNPSSSGKYHIVRVIDKIREMLIGEKLDEVARSYQVMAQRQEWFITPDGEGYLDRDERFEPFCMEIELFLDLYEELK